VASISHTEQQQQQQQLTLSEAQLKSLLDASAAQAAAATAAAVSAATPVPAAPMKTPLEVYAALAADGVKRCTEIPLFKLLVLSVYAGVYVSFGGFVSTSVVSILPGGCLL
jgi:crotonobetainyl-CoA:carnitine CoA-transferase CaiB-like acyl-CoA transferase